MIRCGDKIRLTSVEVDRWLIRTGFSPQYIETMEELKIFVDQCKRHFRGNSAEKKLMHAIIEASYEECLLAWARIDGGF